MANFKSNGELSPEISGLMTSIIGSLPRTAHSLRLTRRGKRFSRNFKPTVLVWSLFVSALLLLSFASFALKFIFTGYEETGISSTLGVQIVNNSESSSLKFLDLEGAGNGTSDVAGNGESGTTLSFQEVEKVSESIVVDTPPKRKLRKRHFACNISFSDKVEHIIQPEEVRNFSRFFLEYMSEDKKPLEASSFESKFGGHQTMEEREVSFYAKNQTVHCGFVKAPPGFRSTGFDLEEKDRAYMNSCVVVVSSCIFGSSDFLRRPSSKKISDFSKENVCFVMFVDEQTLSKLSYDGNVPDENGHIGLWKIVVVRNLPYTDMRRTGKVPKLLSHRLFPSASYSIWIDSKMRLVTDPMLIIDYFLWRTRSDFAISNHYDRHCVWEEVLQNKRLDKYNHTAIDEQFNFYQSDGLTKFDPLDKNSPLPSFVPEGSFIIRAHTPMSNLFSCLWFNEVDRFTSRDQLSFAYTYLKLRRLNPDQPFYLNMFKDCERRALTKLFRHRELA